VTLTRFHLLMAAATLLGGGSIAFGWFVSVPDEMPRLMPAQRATPPIIPKMPPQKLAPDFKAIVERPLFSQTRRPSPPPAPTPSVIVAKQDAPPAPLVATLIGIVISPDIRSAVLRMGDGKNITITEGDSVDGWKLSEVLPDTARFKHVATTIELSFPVLPKNVANVTRPSALAATPVRRRQ
jgi:hypothetical protein